MKLTNEEIGRNFNLLGYFYNPLKRVFLWNRPEKVITKSIALINPDSNVLVVGGGADNTIQQLLKQEKAKAITHLDISKVLSEKARKRIKNVSGCEQVNFEIKPYLEMDAKPVFDVVILPFYLDLFDAIDLEKNINHTAKNLKPNGQVYVIDFSSSQNQTLWMRLKVRILYLLFYPVIGNRNTRIPDYDVFFKECGFKKEFEKCFYNGFYSIKAFRKSISEQP